MKALLLVSGGYDSHVIASLCENLGYRPHFLFFNYGQLSYDREKEAVIKICSLYSDCGFRLSDGLTEIKVDMPWAINLEQTNYFPWRNLIFMSYALSYAEARKYDMIVTGINASALGYPDTTPEFLDTFEKNCKAIDVKLWTPLQELYKGDVFELGTKLGVDIKDTWSCDYSNTEPCGKCGSCVDVQRGYEDGFLAKKLIW